MRPSSLAGILIAGLVLSFSSSYAQQDKKSPDKKAEKKKPLKQGSGTFTDPAEAGPDFLIQGEYEGELTGKGKLGVQVVALGDGRFDAYLLKGGLPGAGWDTKTRTRRQVEAKTENGKTTLTGTSESPNVTLKIIKGKMTGKMAFLDPILHEVTEPKFTVKRVERKSPTLGANPPEGALILFDGKNADEWEGGKVVEMDLLFRGTTSKKVLSAGKLHIEFRTPFQPKARGQSRGNSGVYMRNFEVQVLDSFGLTGTNDECGAYYGIAKPAVNMCLPPLSWQTFDIEIRADDKGNTISTVYHNGVKIHDDLTLQKKPPTRAKIHLQNHGNPVVYRNIWFVEGK